MSILEDHPGLRYADGLAAYLSQGGETALLSAYELGRRALDEGLDVLDIVAIHGDAVGRAVAAASGGEEAAAIVGRATVFFADVAAPYEMVHRGYREANATLRHLSENLEENVAVRTRELEESLAVTRKLNAERQLLLRHLVRAQEEERKRIADDIHDAPIQTITAVGLRLEMIRRRAPGEVAAELETLGVTVGTAVEQLRHLLFDLRPLALDTRGLVAAMSEQLERVAEEAELGFSLEDRLSSEPPPTPRVVLYRIFQEAVSNARVHARASRLDVEVTDEGGGVRVTVRDDGRGFSPGDVPESAPGHLGLTSMRERAEMAGGWFEIQSATGAGTTVRFWVPTTEEKPASD